MQGCAFCLCGDQSDWDKAVKVPDQDAVGGPVHNYRASGQRQTGGRWIQEPSWLSKRINFTRVCYISPAGNNPILMHVLHLSVIIVGILYSVVSSQSWLDKSRFQVYLSISNRYRYKRIIIDAGHWSIIMALHNAIKGFIGSMNSKLLWFLLFEDTLI